MYKLFQYTDELSSISEKEWIKQADNLGDLGVLVSDDVISIYNSIEHDQAEHEHVYFLSVDEQSPAKAVLKIMQAKPFAGEHSYLKLLNIHVEPKLHLDNDRINSEKDEQLVEELYKVIASSMLESINLIFLNSLCKLKVYGRTQEMRNLFFALTKDQNLINLFDGKQLRVTLEGAWLVIQNKENGGK